MQENNTVSMIIRIIVPSPYHDHWAETQPNSGSLAKTRPTVEISYDLFGTVSLWQHPTSPRASTSMLPAWRGSAFRSQQPWVNDLNSIPKLDGMPR